MFTMLLGSMLQVIIRIMGNNAADQLISNFSEVLHKSSSKQEYVFHGNPPN